MGLGLHTTWSHLGLVSVSDSVLLVKTVQDSITENPPAAAVLLLLCSDTAFLPSSFIRSLSDNGSK